MRYYGIARKKAKEMLLFKIAQMQYFLMQHCSQSDQKRDYYKYLYQEHFTIHPPRIRQNYSIPEGKHCNPVCLITSDLILRENLPQLKKGLVGLLKKHHSHKFFGVSRSIGEILSSVENMDDALTWHCSSIDAGRFDFDILPSLAFYIDHFDLHIKAINNSYLSVESHIYFTDQYANELQHIINSDITEQKTYVNFIFRRSKRESGGKEALSLCQYNEANQKSDLIYENIACLKWRFYQVLQKYIPTVLHGLGVTPPGLLFYQTNIDYSDSSAKWFWSSLGLSTIDGQFIDDSQKIFFKTQLSGRYPKHTYSDMIYIYHDEKLKLEGGFYSLAFQTVYSFCWDYSCSFFTFQFLDILNNYYSKELIQYKHRLNRVKLRKNRIHNLLKLHYSFARDMDAYDRFIADDNWNQAAKTVGELFSNKRTIRSFDNTLFTGIPQGTMKRIQEQQNVLIKDFESKESILQHLADYKHESRNRIISFVMLLIAILTLVLLIFPEWSKVIASWLTETWSWLISHF